MTKKCEYCSSENILPKDVLLTEALSKDVSFKGFSPKGLEDVQNHPAKHQLPIDHVGIKDYQLPLLVRDRAYGSQHTVASVDMGVDLPAEFKGTHMSRFLEALERWRATDSNGTMSRMLDYPSMRALLEDIGEKLSAKKAYVRFNFPYFRIKKAPVTQNSAPVAYKCCFTGEWEAGKTSFLIDIHVPITTVCPCSKAISKAGAHGQRTIVRMLIRMKRFEWIEDFIDIAESSGSAPIYAILKREDEKAVTEQAYDNPLFVEDVVRNVASKLDQNQHISWFRVEVESHESIHGHNAFACIESKALE